MKSARKSLVLPALLAAALLAPSVSRADDAATKTLFSKKCAMCHGEDGQAKTKMAEKHKISSFVDAGWQARHSDEKILKAITEGVPDTKMKGMKGKLTDEQIASLAKYVRTFAPKAEAAAPAAEPAAK